MKIRLLLFLVSALFSLTSFCVLRAEASPPASSVATPAAPPPAPALAAPQGKVPPPPGSVDISNEPVVKVVANVLPAVVNIQAEGTVPEYYTAYDIYFRRFQGVRNTPEQSIGSGLIVSADGYIVTNAHVVALAEKEKMVNITLNSYSKYQAQIITSDEDKDLALLKITDQSVQFPYFDLSYVSPNYLGETVVALGSPAGYQNSVSQGILSAKNRTFTVEEHTYKNLLQTDAAINPGNSGGPLVDLNGGLVGLNSAKLAGTAIENIGFAIPNETVVPWVNDAIAVARGLKPPTANPIAQIEDIIQQRLGIKVKTLSSNKAAELNMQLNGGLLITEVAQNSPAARAGLRQNMVIVAVGNRQVTDEKSLPRELQTLQAGGKVRLQVVVAQSFGDISIQRGGSVMLTAK